MPLPLAIDSYLFSYFTKSYSFLPVNTFLNCNASLFEYLVNYCQRGISARLEEEQSFWEVRLRAPSTSKQQTLLPGWEVFTTVLGPTRVVPKTDGGPFLTKLINIRAVQKFPII